MESAELTNFREWKVWSRSTAHEAPSASGIYVFRLAGGNPFGRLKGESDIVYIGSSARVRNRVKGHLRVMTVERNVAYYLERVEQVVGRLEVAWEAYPTPEKAKDAERELLGRYEAAHIEFPPLNRAEAGKRQRMVGELLRLDPAGGVRMLLEALANLQAKEAQRTHSVGKEET